jgi:HK97 family phage prohead protease
MTIKTHKAASNSITDVDLGKRTAITAYATYGSLDRDKDRAHKGMFTKSWQEFSDVRVFLNHDKTQAPGKLSDGSVTKSMWEDNDHAYAKMWFGTHTLGDDTLKMMDEGIITDSSYYMLPTKYKKNEAGGYNFTEVFLKEVSVLTHWGAHPESKIVSVQKAASEVEMGDAILKQLNSDEVAFLRQFVGNLNGNLLSLVAFSAGLPETSDIYTWINSLIGDISYTVSRFKDRLVWGQKCWTPDELTQRLSKFKSFIKNTTASDDAIKKVLKEAEELETFLMMEGTHEAAQPTEQSKSSENSETLALLNIKMLLQS